jgi:uncharacterized protein YjbI with pentapeptide repeats
MATPAHLQILQQGVETWNQWRDRHRALRPDLSRADLSGANLTETTLTGANLSHVQLFETVFGDTDFTAVQGLKDLWYQIDYFER